MEEEVEEEDPNNEEEEQSDKAVEEVEDAHPLTPKSLKQKCTSKKHEGVYSIQYPALVFMIQPRQSQKFTLLKSHTSCQYSQLLKHGNL